MKIKNINSFQDSYKCKFASRVFVSITSIATSCFGTYYFYEVIVQEAVNYFDLSIAVSLITLGAILLFSCNYYRLILTSTSLAQKGLIISRQVDFDLITVLVDNGNGSYRIYNSKSEIRIPSDIEKSDDLIHRLTSIITSITK